MTKDEFKAMRAELGLTQREMASLFRVGLRHVQKWEGGKAEIMGTALVLAEIIRDVPAVRRHLGFKKIDEAAKYRLHRAP